MIVTLTVGEFGSVQYSEYTHTGCKACMIVNYQSEYQTETRHACMHACTNDTHRPV